MLTVQKKLRTPAVVFFFMGIGNLLSVVLILKFDPGVGVYALVVPTMIIKSAYELLFIVPYTCKCLDCRMSSLYSSIAKSFATTMSILMIGICVNSIFEATSWTLLIIKCVILGCVGLMISWISILDGESRIKICNLIKKRIRCMNNSSKG